LNSIYFPEECVIIMRYENRIHYASAAQPVGSTSKLKANRENWHHKAQKAGGGNCGALCRYRSYFSGFSIQGK